MKIKALFTKHGYLTYSVMALCAVWLSDCKGWVFQVSESGTETISVLAGVFLIFQIIFAGMFLALPKNGRFMQFITHYNHHVKVLKRTLFGGILAFLITAAGGILNLPLRVIQYIFFVGLETAAVLIYYLYFLFCRKFDERSGRE